MLEGYYKGAMGVIHGFSMGVSVFFSCDNGGITGILQGSYICVIGVSQLVPSAFPVFSPYFQGSFPILS